MFSDYTIGPLSISDYALLILPPLYNFIHDTQMTKVLFLWLLQPYWNLLRFQHFSRKWQKLPAGLFAGSMQNETPVHWCLCIVRMFHLCKAGFSLHNTKY